MNIKTITTCIFLCLSFTVTSQSINCDCSDALNTALKNKYTDTELIDIRIELYEYYQFLKSSSSNTSTSFDLSAEAQAFLPVGIFSGDGDAGGDYSKANIRNLKEIIEKEQRISMDVFKKLSIEVFSDNQLQAYESCLENCSAQNQNGVFYEITGDLEDVFAVNLHFINTVGQEKVTISSNATLVNCEPIGSFFLKEGLEIKNHRSVTQYLKIIDKEKSAQIGVNFEELSFGAINFGEELYRGGKALPIGAIVQSPFNYDTFLEANRITKTSNMSKAIWVPCDGRNVSSSTYGDFSGNVPDLRGLFLRNVNDYNEPFDGVAQVSKSQSNPDNTPAGVFQQDAFQGHKHSKNNAMSVGGNGGQIEWGGGPKRTTVSQDAGKQKVGYGTPRISTETRPRNMTVYYYVKINN